MGSASETEITPSPSMSYFFVRNVNAAVGNMAILSLSAVVMILLAIGGHLA
jgi:hypothetical protein